MTTPKGKQIAFEQAGLGSVLKQNKLEVPPNQRDYAWTEKEVRQLFRDLAKAQNDNADYFLGAIVTIPQNNSVLEVVDGQQRLATTAIFLAAIREYLKTRGEEILVESIDNEFLTSIDRESRTRVPNLKLNIDDNDLFRQIAAGGSIDTAGNFTRASHELLKAAFKEAQDQVQKIVASLDPKDHGDELNRWVSFIEHNALVVLLRVPDTADAYKMFETLNARGLDTSQADLIKNHLFSKAGDRLAEVQTRWGYMRGALETLEETDITVTFLRQALIVLNGFLREAEVFDKVENMARSSTSTVSLTISFESLANDYVAIRNPQHERWNGYTEQTRRSIEVFELFNIRPMRPLILAVSTRFTPKETGRAFQFLISLGVRLLIASSTRSGTVEEALATAANRVHTDAITDAAALKQELATITPSDSQFYAAFAAVRIANSRQARYYLRSLEMTAEGEQEPWFVPQGDPQVINLEHVLPRKPEGNWPEFTDDDVKSYVTRLGNLVLLQVSGNSNLNNGSFSVKKPIFAASPYVLTNMLGSVDTWTPEEIGKRQDKLAEYASKTWPI
jgi:Protein of unknown function DUF262/Protein of unknown function (DUF1524)